MVNNLPEKIFFPVKNQEKTLFLSDNFHKKTFISIKKGYEVS